MPQQQRQAPQQLPNQSALFEWRAEREKRLRGVMVQMEDQSADISALALTW